MTIINNDYDKTTMLLCLKPLKAFVRTLLGLKSTQAIVRDETIYFLDKEAENLQKVQSQLVILSKLVVEV